MEPTRKVCPNVQKTAVLLRASQGVTIFNIQERVKLPVLEGYRCGVWGTLPLITCTTVRFTISRVSQLGCVNEILIRRKFESGQSTRSGMDKWWFVLHGGEDRTCFNPSKLPGKL